MNRRPQKLLALDSAGAACSTAVWCAGLAARRFEARRRGHAERLLPMVEEVMAEAGLRYCELDAIAVTLGPGSFTGVRVGLATARALSLASGRPLIGFDSFTVVAAGVRSEHRVGRRLFVTLDARRAELYVQTFARDTVPLGPPAMLSPQDLAGSLVAGPALLAGDGLMQALPPAETCRADIAVAEEARFADAAVLVALAAAGPEPSAATPSPSPLYLRSPDVTLAQGGPR